MISFDGKKKHQVSINDASEYPHGLQLVQVSLCVAWYFHCFKLFAIEKYIMHLMLHEFICAMNIMLKNKLKWINKIEMVEIMIGFKDFYGLASIHGAIDATHIHLHKPKGQHFVVDYYSFKLKRHITFNYKQLWITKDDFMISLLLFLVLWMMHEYYGFLFYIIEPLMETYLLLIVEKKEFNHISLVIKGIPLLLWLMVPHKQIGVRHIVLEVLFNQ